jgi:Zn-dependent protease/CBS domain-containing protein
MKWSYSITKVAGIDVRVHATFLLLLVWWGYTGYQFGGVPEAQESVIFILLLFLCVLLHEFGHALAARRYGIHTPDITLYPIGGVARLERMPENPVQELVIAIAGPMVNVAIALLLWIALGMPLTNPMEQFGGAPTLAAELMRVNVMLIVFNMIPAFPMDGGRVLRALLAMRMSYASASVIAARTGQGVAVVLGLIGFFGIPEEIRSVPVLGLLAGVFGSGANFFLVFIAMFVFSAAQQEADFAGMRNALSGRRIGDAMITRFQMMTSEMPVSEAAAEALRDTQSVYPVVDAQMRPVGVVFRNALVQTATGTVGSVAQVVPIVRSDATFDEAFQLMRESGLGLLPVVNAGGQLVGLVSLHQLSERAREQRSRPG